MRVLAVCGDLWHPAAMVRRALDPFKQEMELEFAEADSASQLKDLEKFQVVLLARANIHSDGNLQPWLKSDTEHGFVDFVKNGGGLFVVHAGLSRYKMLPAMSRLIGGSFMSHPPLCAITIEPKAGHFLVDDVKAFGGQDEHYFVNFNGSDASVFLESRSEHGVQPAGWTRTEGAGRVCVITPGHSLEIWSHPEFQKLLWIGLRWTATEHAHH